MQYLGLVPSLHWQSLTDYQVLFTARTHYPKRPVIELLLIEDNKRIEFRHGSKQTVLGVWY